MADLTPDAFMAQQQGASGTDLTPDSFMATVDAQQPAAAPPGLPKISPDHTMLESLTQRYPGLKEFLFANAMTSAGLKNATDLYDTAAGGVADLASKALGVPKSTLDQNISPIPGLISGVNEVARTVPELVDFAMTPGGALAIAGPKIPKLGPYVRPGVGAAFTVDMAQQLPAAVEEARNNPTPENLVKLGKAVLFTAAPAWHARGEVKAEAAKRAPIKLAPDTPAEAEASKAALATNEDLALARTDPAQAGPVVNREIASRQKAGQWDREFTPSPEEARARKKANRVQVPEEGDPDPILTYQRGNVAAELAGKPYEELTPEERGVADDLVRQGFGMRETKLPEAETKPAASETTAEFAATPSDAGTLPGDVAAPREAPAPVETRQRLTPEQIMARIEADNEAARQIGLREDAQRILDESTLDAATKPLPDVRLTEDGRVVEPRPQTWQEAQAARRAERVAPEPAPLLDQVADATETQPMEFMRRLDETGREASTRLRKRLSATSSANEFLNPETIRDMALSIAGDVARGVLKLEDLGRRLSAEYGPKARVIAQKVWNEAQNILKPLGAHSYGEHGPVFRDYWRDEEGATKKLKEIGAGDARGALYHPQIGLIDLMWGEAGDPANGFKDGYGLAKILAKHPEMEGKIQEFLKSADIIERHGNKMTVANSTHEGSVKLEWAGKKKNWLLTAYEPQAGKAKSEGAAAREGGWTSRAPHVGIEATAPAENGGSVPRMPATENLVNRGAEFISEGASKFGAWSKAMRDEFPGLKTAEAAKIWGQAKRRSTQRGSVTIGPVGPKPAEAPAAPPVEPKKAATAAPPEDAAIPVSPSYDKTKGKILDKLNVSDETKAATAGEMGKWEAANPERKRITHAEIEANARQIDPSVLADISRADAQKMAIQNPALYHAARKAIPGLLEQAARLNEEIRNKPRDVDSIELERKRDQVERDVQQLIGVTTAVRSQHGRNLAMHKIMVDTIGFDPTYWNGRAKRSLGLPADASLPVDVQREIGGALAEGAKAEKEALGRIREQGAKRKQAEAEAGARTAKHKQAKGETAKELDRLAMVEKKRKQIISQLKAQLLDPKQGNDPVMPEEYAAFEKDAEIVQLRGALAVKRAMAELERDKKPEFADRQAAVEDAKKKLVKRLEAVLRGEKSTVNPVSPEERLAFEADPAVQKLRKQIEEKRIREKVPVSQQMRVEKGVQRRLDAIDDKLNPKPPSAPGEWSLSAEEKKLIEADPRVQEARRNLAKKMAKLEQTTLLEAISSFRRAGLLTSPRTHIRNFLGNTTMQALEETSRVPGSMLDIGLSLFSGQRTLEGASGRAVARASYAAATKGIAEAKQVMKHGATDEQLAQFDMPKEMNLGPGRVSQVFEKYVNTVFRSLSAADRVFKRYAIQRSLEEQMKLAKVDAPTEAMMAQAIADADFATFNNKNKLADMYSRAKAGASPGARFAMDMAVPFVRTPANVLARVLDYSGGGLVKASYHGIRAAIDKAMTPEQQRAISANFGRGVTGPALIYIGYQLAAAGLATGSYQADAGKRNTDEAAGRLAGAVKLGDTWQMVSPLSPGGALITIGATLQREATGPIKDEAKRPGKLAAVVGRTVLDHPFLQGAKEIADAVTSPAQQGERALASMAGSFVPSAAADVASLGDSVRRDSRSDGGFVDAAAAAMAARTPGARNTLPERKDVLGRQLPQSKSAVVNPGIGSQAKEDSDPIARELVRNKVALSEPQRAPGETLDEFRLRREVLGREIEKQLGREIKSPTYARLETEEERRLALDKAESRARRLVNAKLGKRYAGAAGAARLTMLRELLKGNQ